MKKLLLIPILLVAIVIPVYAQGYDPNDDFSSTELDEKWTVTYGTEGTVDSTSTNSGTIYDLSSKEGYLASQANNGSFYMRQDYSLPDGKSAVLTLSPAVNTSANNADEVLIGIGLNSDNDYPTQLTTSGYSLLQFRATNDTWVIQSIAKNSSGAIIAESLFGGFQHHEATFNGIKMKLKITRKDSQYMFSASFGGTFAPFGAFHTPSGVHTNLWIRNSSYLSYTGGRIIPVQLIDSVEIIDNSEI